MNISVYLNDGEVISSVDINEATVEEALSAIKAFGFGENEEERDEWKEKYKIECQNNDNLKQAFKNLENSSSNLLKRLDEQLEEYKQIASDRDDLKVQLDNANLTIESLRVNRDEWYNSYRDKQNLCDKINAEKDELQKMFNFVREDYYTANHQMSELIKENDKLKKDRNLYEHYLKKILFDKGYSNEAMAFLQIMERKECQNKKSES